MKKGKQNNNVNPMGDPISMQKHATEIFRDMSKGRCDLNQVIPKFYNQQFLEACLMAFSSNHRRHTIMYNALCIAYQNSNDADVVSLKNIEMSYLKSWEIVYEFVNAIIQTGDVNGRIVGLFNRLSMDRGIRF